MQTYKMIDTWEAEPEQYKTRDEIFKMAYELYCGNPVGQELTESKRVLNTFEKAIRYIEQECGWRVRIRHV